MYRHMKYNPLFILTHKKNPFCQKKQVNCYKQNDRNGSSDVIVITQCVNVKINRETFT